jgi:hypothetical protein
MAHPELSIGQRLAVGFTVLLLLFLAVGGIVTIVQNRSAEAQRVYSDEVLPRAALANSLEQAMLYTAVNTRSYILAPIPENLQRAEGNITRVRELLRLLADEAASYENADLVAGLPGRVESYLRLVSEAMANPSADFFGARAGDIGGDARAGLNLAA